MAENKRQNEVIEMSAAEIRAFALRVKYLAAQIETVAESLEKMSEKRLKGTGFATADRGAGYLRTFVGTIRSALDDLALLVPEGQKSGKVETSPITPDFVELIRKQSTTVGAVFPLPVATHFTVSDVIAKIGRAAGVMVSATKFASAHDLRRSFASRWSLKVTPAVLRSLMRHASISTTMEFYVRHESDEIAAILQEFAKPKKSRK